MMYRNVYAESHLSRAAISTYWKLAYFPFYYLFILPVGMLDEDNQWMTQINRLQKLIDRLEKKVLKSIAWAFLPIKRTYFFLLQAAHTSLLLLGFVADITLILKVLY